MAKLTIKDTLYDRAKRMATQQGYSSVEEFVEHAIDNELKRGDETDQAEQQVADQLRGLGYIE